MVEPIFKNDKTKIKKVDEFKKALRQVAYLSPKEEKEVLNRARPSLHSSEGMSKKEFLTKVVRPFQMNTKDDIDYEEVRRLKKMVKK